VGSGVALVAVIAALASSAAPAGVARTQLVGCAQAVYGPLGTWRTAPNAVVAGPVGWPYLLTPPPSHAVYGPHEGLALFAKALLAIEPGRTATIRIPANERSRLSLYYRKTFDPRRQWHGAGLFRVSDGSAEITFEACPRGPGSEWTQFAGGFLVRGAQCGVVEVKARGSARWLRRRIPFGKRTCG